MVDLLFPHIQDLDNYKDSTKRGGASLILEEDLDIMDGPSVNTESEMIPFWGYYSKFSILPNSNGFC